MGVISKMITPEQLTKIMEAEAEMHMNEKMKVINAFTSVHPNILKECYKSGFQSCQAILMGEIDHNAMINKSRNIFYCEIINGSAVKSYGEISPREAIDAAMKESYK